MGKVPTDDRRIGDLTDDELRAWFTDLIDRVITQEAEELARDNDEIDRAALVGRVRRRFADVDARLSKRMPDWPTTTPTDAEMLVDVWVADHIQGG